MQSDGCIKYGQLQQNQQHTDGISNCNKVVLHLNGYKCAQSFEQANRNTNTYVEISIHLHMRHTYTHASKCSDIHEITCKAVALERFTSAAASPLILTCIHILYMWQVQKCRCVYMCACRFINCTLSRCFVGVL